MKYIVRGILVLLFSGCTLLHPPDPQRAEALRREAEALILRQEYIAAVARLSEAIRLQPENGALYLRYGELLERNGDLAAARHSYRTGLKKTSDGGQTKLMHSLALLLALKLDAAEEARQFMERLPADSPQRDDLLGVFLSIEGKQREALLQFNAVLAKNPGKDVTAAILYHAALAYHRLGDEKNVLTTLYEAINRTGNPALAKDIEILWNRIKDAPPKTSAGRP